MLPPVVEEPRQSLGPYVVVVRVARAEVGQVHGYAARYVPLEPAREPGKVLAPVERTVDQMPVGLPRAACELVEVGEVVRPGADRRNDAREHRRRDRQAGGTSARLEPVREPAGHGGVRRQQVAVAEVEVAPDCAGPVDGQQRPQRRRAVEGLAPHDRTGCPGCHQREEGQGRLHRETVREEPPPADEAVLAVQERRAVGRQPEEAREAVQEGLREQLVIAAEPDRGGERAGPAQHVGPVERIRLG